MMIIIITRMRAMAGLAAIAIADGVDYVWQVGTPLMVVGVGNKNSSS
jgi:hypothetical protein